MSYHYSNPYHRCGLYPIHAGGGGPENFPLVNTRVHYDLVDVQALATVTQAYTSNATTDLEVKYIFPLPPDASVCAFKAVIDGERTIKGIVKAKEKAKAEYDEAVSKGKTAALLEQDNVEIFQLSLGNIRPKQIIEVHISFAVVISHNGDLDSLRLTFPCAIAPRYGTPPNQMLNYLTNAWPWKHPLIRKFNNAVDFSLSVQMTSHIKSVTSPSHPIEMKLGQSTSESTTEFDPFKAHVSLTSPTLLDKDIIVAMACVGLDKPRCTVETYAPEEGAQEHTNAYALTLVPRFELPPLPTQEYIFLVDRSGSMSGGKIRAVRSALQIMLRSLPPRGTSFNIISFGSSHSALWRSSSLYTAESVNKATKHVDKMDADFGGTEIRLAIEYAFKSRSNPATPAAVFVLTDGEAYDLDGVQAAVAAEVAKAKTSKGLLRVFCMGIGNAVSKAMCDLIARIGQGTTMYVGEEEKPDQKLMALLRAARGALVENISIDWGVPDEKSKGDDFELVSTEDAPPPDYPKETLPPISLFDEKAIPNVEQEKTTLGPDTKPVELPPPPLIQQAPSSDTLPPLYPGFRTSVFAIVRREGKEKVVSSKICINGTVMGQKVQLEVPVTQAMAPHASATEKKIKMLHVLAARALVQRFEDEGKATVMSAVHKAEVLRVAERYAIASSETSFVAVDENSVNTGYAVREEHARETAPQAPFHAGSGRSIAPIGGAFRYSGSGGLRGSSLSPLPSSGLMFCSLPPPGAPLPPPPSRPQAAAAPLPPSIPPLPAMSMDSASVTDLLQNSVIHSEAVKSLDVEEDALVVYDGCTYSGLPMKKKGGSVFGSIGRFRHSARAKSEVEKASATTPSKSSALPLTIETFARAQSFEGFFPPSAPICKLLIESSTAPMVSLTVLTKAGKDAGTIWSTLLCVAYLEAKFKEEKDVWEIMVEKALSWVEDTLHPVVGADKVSETKDALLEEARKHV